jgi:hypothetical protein
VDRTRAAAVLDRARQTAIEMGAPGVIERIDTLSG